MGPVVALSGNLSTQDLAAGGLMLEPGATIAFGRYRTDANSSPMGGRLSSAAALSTYFWR
jgi:hypothetical protein